MIEERVREAERTEREKRLTEAVGGEVREVDRGEREGE